jgi:sulfoxide reductase heme-binding subunit YedZ
VASTIDSRYRLVYKPAVFIACLVPFAWALGGILASSGVLPFSWSVLDLGADPVRRLLGIVGKSALNLLLITLAITPLRQLTGNAHLLRLRRMLGLFAFSYALTHFLVYVGLFQAFSWSEIVKDLYKRWYIILGFTALLLLVPLAITSTNAMMRRLKRRWQTLHRLIYVIAILGVSHYWIQTKKDLRQPEIYAAILALLLGWRVWRAWQKHQATSRSAPPIAQERT